MTAPAAECSAQNRNYESGPRLCIRAAQHHGDHIDERGFHWSDTTAVYPVDDGTSRRGTDVRAALRRMADEEQVDRLASWLWDNCAEDERTGLLADDPRRIAAVALRWPELRRMADEEQQPETPRKWCKCPSCWGWFVDEHPGEDLDELGKDLGWWSGLPEHRDAPAAVAQPETQPETDTARLANVVRWVTSEVVTARTEFGNGYRAAQRDIRDLIKGRFDNDPKPAAVAQPGGEA